MKIFGIGFHKTGTTSLAVALRQLGFSVTGPNNVNDPNIKERYIAIARELSQHFDAFQDNLWPIVFRDLDEIWPDARFILTTRDPEIWIRSQIWHFGSRTTPMRELIYGTGFGCPLGNERHYIDVMEAHVAAVRTHFHDRPGKLLEIDLSAGHGWTEICTFLGVDTPNCSFPRANTAEEREAQTTAVGRLKRATRRLLMRLT